MTGAEAGRPWRAPQACVREERKRAGSSNAIGFTSRFRIVAHPSMDESPVMQPLGEIQPTRTPGAAARRSPE